MRAWTARQGRPEEREIGKNGPAQTGPGPRRARLRRTRMSILRDVIGSKKYSASPDPKLPGNISPDWQASLNFHGIRKLCADPVRNAGGKWWRPDLEKIPSLTSWVLIITAIGSKTFVPALPEQA